MNRSRILRRGPRRKVDRFLAGQKPQSLTTKIQAYSSTSSTERGKIAPVA